MERRYCGSADLPLCPQGIAHARSSAAALHGELKTALSDVRRVYVSPLARCRQTARIFFPDKELVEVPDFREIDFGVFEGHTADELFADAELRAAYQAWVDSYCELPVPGGESKQAFCRRVRASFRSVLAAERNSGIIVLVAHGGTNMALLEAFASERRAYWEWGMGAAEWALVPVTAVHSGG